MRTCGASLLMITERNELAKETVARHIGRPRPVIREEFCVAVATHTRSPACGAFVSSAFVKSSQYLGITAKSD